MTMPGLRDDSTPTMSASMNPMNRGHVDSKPETTAQRADAMRLALRRRINLHRYAAAFHSLPQAAKTARMVQKYAVRLLRRQVPIVRLRHHGVLQPLSMRRDAGVAGRSTTANKGIGDHLARRCVVAGDAALPSPESKCERTLRGAQSGPDF